MRDLRTRGDVRGSRLTLKNVRSFCELESFSHLPEVVSKSSVGPFTSATRILDGITARRWDMHCDMCLDVVRNPAWSSLVMKRLAAKALPLMPKTNVLGPREPSDRDTLQVLLLRETLGTDHAFLDQSLTYLGNHSERGAPPEILSRTQRATIEKMIQHLSCANAAPSASYQEQHKSPGPGILARGCSRQDVNKNTCDHAGGMMFTAYTQLSPRAVWIFDMRNMAPATRSTLRHDDPLCQTSGILPHFLGANTSGSPSSFRQWLLSGHTPRS